MKLAAERLRTEWCTSMPAFTEREGGRPRKRDIVAILEILPVHKNKYGPVPTV